MRTKTAAAAMTIAVAQASKKAFMIHPGRRTALHGTLYRLLALGSNNLSPAN